MKKAAYALFISAIAAIAFWACDDNSSSIGASLSGSPIEILIDSVEDFSGTVVDVKAIRPKTSDLLIGRISIPAYGTLELSSAFQFLPSTSLDTATFNAANLDSIILTFRYARGAFLGDSVVPMGIGLHKLTEVLKPSLNSADNPEGLYEPALFASRIYNASTFNASADAQSLTYRDINIKLDRSFGDYLFRSFEEHPEYYADGQTFARNVFKGFYLDTNFGSGRITRIGLTTMNMHLHKITQEQSGDSIISDTTIAQHTYYMITPEVVCNNFIKYTESDNIRALREAGHKIVVAPAATELEITLPINKLLTNYRARTQNAIGVINDMTLTIPVDTIANGIGMTPPPYMLLVLKRDRDTFFAQNQLTNDSTSFYVAYNENNQAYNISSMRNYITRLIAQDQITEDDCTFSFVPVTINFENLAGGSGYYSYYYGTGSSSQTECEIVPYLAAPVMGDIRLDKAKIKLSYSLQTQK